MAIVSERSGAPSAAAGAPDVEVLFPEARRRERHRRLAFGLAVLVVAAAAGTLAAVVAGGPPRSRATPPASHGAPGAVAAGVAGSWQVESAGPAPGYVTCPTTTACYTTSTVGGYVFRYGAVDFSSDEGRRWSAVPVPSDFYFTTPLSCTAATVCAGGGSEHGTSVLISTADGGRHWSVHRLGLDGGLLDLACSTAAICAGVLAPLEPGVPPTIGRLHDTERFVRTVDGGVSWSSHALPRGDQVAALACPSATRCLLVGLREVSALDVALFTDDSGASWHTSTLSSLPEGFFTSQSVLSCGDGAHCMVIAGGYPTESPQIATTSDGGASWQPRPSPRDIREPRLSAAACSGAGSCWVAGGEAIAHADNAFSAVLFETTDDGSTWVKAIFHFPARAFSSYRSYQRYEYINTIACPAPSSCVALGAEPPEQLTAPVYNELVSKSRS